MKYRNGVIFQIHLFYMIQMSYGYYLFLIDIALQEQKSSFVEYKISN